MKNDILEVWTCFLLEDGEDITRRLFSLGYDISIEKYKSIYNIFVQNKKIEKILSNLDKSILLDINPNNSSQEAIESFLKRVNDDYMSEFTLDDFDLYARNKVFFDIDAEKKETLKIQFRKLYENPLKMDDCIIPQNISLDKNEMSNCDFKNNSILDGFLNKDSTTLFTASGGIGKSALILNMMLALGSKDADSWMGFKKNKSKYTSLIVQQEDTQHTITNRLKLMCQDDTLKDGLNSLYFIGNEFQVTDKTLNVDDDEENSLIGYITENIKNLYISGKDIPDILVLDSLSVFAGCSENDSMSMRQVMNKIIGLCRKFKMTPIIIHHHGKNSRYRGSSAIIDGVRCHYTLNPLVKKEIDTLKDIDTGEAFHFNEVKRTKSNDLFGSFSFKYVITTNLQPHLFGG